MKKLILNLIFPCLFILMTVDVIAETPVVAPGNNKIITHLVVYKGEIILSVNLPTVEITGKRNIVKDEKNKTKVKGAPERYGPQQKIRRNSPTM